MSSLDRVIASLLRNIDDLQRVMADTELVKSKLEELRDQYEAVGVESDAAIASATIDWVEQLQAEGPVFQAQFEGLISQAEGLKIGPGIAATGNGSTGTDTSPEPVATTGADPRPNPVHATPAHTREPSRKIGDPVKPVETEPEKDVTRSRLNRFARQKVRDSEDLKDSAESISESLDNILGQTFDPWGSEARTETHTSPSQPVSQAPHSQETGTPEIVGTVTIMGVALIEGCSRIWERYTSNRQGRNGNDSNG